MSVECGVIAVIFMVFVLLFFRRDHKEWAIATIPLILLPLSDVILETVVIKFMKIEVTAFGAILTLVIIVAVSAAWIGAVSQALRTRHKKRTAATFIGITNLFNVALAAILISDILSRAEKLEAIIN